LIPKAKKVFHIHGVDVAGNVVVSRRLRRKEVFAFFAKLPPCLVGVEACGSAHYWGREIGKLGHTVKLMPPNYVKPFVKRGKPDPIDAAAQVLLIDTVRLRHSEDRMSAVASASTASDGSEQPANTIEALSPRDIRAHSGHSG
jgi:transposase